MTARPDLDKILSHPDMMIEQTKRGPNGILARLFRQILIDNRFRPAKMDQRIQQFLNKQRAAAELKKQNDPAGYGNPSMITRASIRRVMTADGMTWRGFLESLTVSGATRLEVAVITHYPGNTDKNVTYLSIDLSELGDAPDGEPDEQ
jgi:hypothetical protein